MENNNDNAGSIKVNSRKKGKQPVAQARKTLNFKFIFSEIDKPFFMLVFVLLIFGITMMYSASFADSMYEYGAGIYYLKKQVVFKSGDYLLCYLCQFWIIIFFKIQRWHIHYF